MYNIHMLLKTKDSLAFNIRSEDLKFGLEVND